MNTSAHRFKTQALAGWVILMFCLEQRDYYYQWKAEEKFFYLFILLKRGPLSRYQSFHLTLTITYHTITTEYNTITPLTLKATKYISVVIGLFCQIKPTPCCRRTKRGLKVWTNCFLSSRLPLTWFLFVIKQTNNLQSRHPLKYFFNTIEKCQQLPLVCSQHQCSVSWKDMKNV